MSDNSGLGGVDLVDGVIPITKAIPVLAELIKRTRTRNEHIVITQSGYPAAVLMGIESYTKMKQYAEKYLEMEAARADREARENEGQ